jgi:tetratricopeptide (TPR) repeat protein
VVVCFLLFFLITAISIFISHRRKYVAMGWLWYVVTLVPMIGLIQAGLQAMANRYMYVSMIGLLIILVWTIKDFIANRPYWKVITAVLVIAALLASLILTRMQVRHWQNSLTLFDYALMVTKNNEVAENSYGIALFREGRFSEAETHFSNAVRISPGFSDARDNLARTFLKEGKLDETVACFNELLRYTKDSAGVYYYLGVALNEQKKYTEAIKRLSDALKLDPNYPGACRMMGSLLLETGKFNEAIPYLNEALRTDAKQAEIYKSLGLVYNQLGKYEQAIQVWRKATELEPNDAGFLNNLAWLLATTKDTSTQDVNKAIELAKRACELTGYKEPAMPDTLSASYAAAGRFDEAVTTAQRAIDIAKACGQNELAYEIQKRTELYRTGQQYRQK